jgi:hypothetical protein
MPSQAKGRGRENEIAGMKANEIPKRTHHEMIPALLRRSLGVTFFYSAKRGGTFCYWKAVLEFLSGFKKIDTQNQESQETVPCRVLSSVKQTNSLSIFDRRTDKRDGE